MLKCDGPLLKFAFKFMLWRYKWAAAEARAAAANAAAAAAAGRALHSTTSRHNLGNFVTETSLRILPKVLVLR
jgi:hypothetical protein